jgi:DNA-binding GntR family transcriptional regulator
MLRRLIEPELAAAAASKCSKRDSYVMDANLGAHTAAFRAGDELKLFECDRDFHQLIANIAARPVSQKAILIAKIELERLRRIVARNAESASMAIKDHEMIAQAIMESDALRARRHMLDHVTRVEVACLAMIDGKMDLEDRVSR